MRSLTILVLVAAAACSGGSGGLEDAAVDAVDAVDAAAIDAADATAVDAADAAAVDAADAAAVDAAAIDAAAIDAAAIDAAGADAIDAPAVDAPDVDAPDVDAPDVDAPDVDAAAIDAPAIDAAAIDAPAIDATPIDAAMPPLDWPAAVAVDAMFIGPGGRACADFAQDHFAHGENLFSLPLTGSHWLVTIGLDATTIESYLTPLPVGGQCSLAVSHDGTLVFTYPLGEASRGIRRSDGAVFATGTDEPKPVAGADPDGGVVVQVRAGTVWKLLRLTDAFTLDPGFGTAGAVTVPELVADRVVQRAGSTVFVTLRIGTDLVRLDLRTGAPVTAFGGTGTVALGVTASTIVGMGPLPGAGVAVLVRGPTATQLTILRIDATGAATSALLDLPFAWQRVTADLQGRLLAGATSAPFALVTRYDLATGALDTSFGTSGRATFERGTVPPPPLCPSPSYTTALSVPTLYGGLGDGRVVLSGTYTCTPTAAGPPTRTGTFYAITP